MTATPTFPTLSVSGPVRRLVVVLGDQLDRSSLAFDGFDDERDAILMMEVDAESTDVPSHRQRTVLFLSAMRHYALEMRDLGRRIEYTQLDDDANAGTLDDEVRRHVDRLQPETVMCVHPGAWRLLEMMQAWVEDFSANVEVLPDEHFIVRPEDFSAWASGRRSLVMEYFYREQRRKLGILVDAAGKPEGGRWNYDADNRVSFSERPVIRSPYRPKTDALTREVIELVERRLPDLPGRLDRFDWPVSRPQARRALADFVEHRLERFGTYEDAMWTGESTVYHSRLSAAINLKLLSPMECVEAALASYEEGRAPLNAVEGFVRQLIGWREFIRGVYWHEGPGYGQRNGLGHTGRLPSFYWTGETDMACMRHSIEQVLDEGYGHHIQRLMVTGNFALLCGIDARAVNDWYLGMFVDGIDWVTVPNTIGMAMHADGGVVGTKPYAASGKYIKRMSNYCDQCRYDVKQRTGDDACPFNTLYWDFLIRHRERFRRNNRMAMMLKNVDRLDAQEQVEITVSARSIRDELGVGAVSEGGVPPCAP
ncbi:MAG: cryptochrome/photolyase family protein [Planctomycetota bacterium]|jgi:deoxyribodipyrimidine photolyase-related protein